MRAFAAVATNRSFTAASRELVITQPALTRTIQQLEAALGVKLLERTSRFVELTATGEAFLGRVLGVLNDLDHALLQVRGQQELRLGFQWLLPDPWATDTIAEFERLTSATVVLLRRDDVSTHLERGDIDLAVTRTRLAAPSTVHTPLFDEGRVAVVSSRSPLADREILDWLELAQEVIVVNTVSGTTRPDSWPPDHQPKRIVTCGNFDEWLQLVVTGRGVGALPESAARTNVHPGVRFVPLAGAPSVSVWLAYQSRRQNPLVRKFISAAVSVRDRPAGRTGS